MTRKLLIGTALTALAAAGAWFQNAHGQEAPFRPRPYDGIQAGVDAYNLAEERRRADLAAQVQTSDYLQSGAYGRGSTIYYYPGVWGGTRETAYAYPFGGVYAARAVSAARLGYASGPFEPWPTVPGDIWGFGNTPRPVRQPIGQRQVQTGPNRWESHPVYDPPLTQHEILPPLASPLLRNTPFANPEPSQPPPLERREF